MKNLILEPSEINRNNIWQYFIINKIDVNATAKNNIENVIDGFVKTGFIYNLLAYSSLINFVFKRAKTRSLWYMWSIKIILLTIP